LRAESTAEVLGRNTDFVETPTHSVLAALFAHWNADVFCIQESKICLRQVPENAMHVPGYESFWSCSRDKKGYSGVTTYVREGLTVRAWEGLGEERFDREGRLLLTDHHK
jgi:exodeoxyribonuclease III